MRELFCAHQKNKEQAQVREVAQLYQLVHMDEPNFSAGPKNKD